MLYRVFPWDPDSTPDPLAVRRDLQGTGRHDNPEHYGAIYLAKEPISAVAERIQGFRGQILVASDLRRPKGRRLALATIDDSALPELTDLDDPRVLVRLRRRPSRIATGDRRETQSLALDRFAAGDVGLAWWSTLEASWINVTLFDVRVTIDTVAEVTLLTLSHDSVRAAKDRLGIRV
jgi:hypothetical protein